MTPPSERTVDRVHEPRDPDVERLLQGPSAYRFAPAPELASIVEQLATFYRSHLVEVTDVIHSRTARKAHQFADAFRLRKDP